VIRWLKFNAAGILGAGVQLAVLGMLLRGGCNYLLATALAVETAVLHNYLWHVHWTWRDRPLSSQFALWRFHLGNGAVSIVSNLALMRVLAGWLGSPPLIASAIAIGATSILIYAIGDRRVFSAAAAAGPAATSDRTTYPSQRRFRS